MPVNFLSLMLSIGPALEVVAYPKPGNVHRLRDFHDTRFEDFIITSLVFVPFMARCIKRGYRGKYGKVLVGDLIYGIVKNSMEIHGGGNTCLGTSTLLVPIALSLGHLLRMSRRIDIKTLAKVSSNLVKRYSTVLDSIYFYKAIRFIKPSYLSPKDKTNGFPNVFSGRYRKELFTKNIRLWDVLQVSARVDIVSKEVVEGYPITLKATSFLKRRLSEGIDWNYAVIDTYLYVLSTTRDTLVMRKHGKEVMDYISMKAREILEVGGSSTLKGFNLLRKFDEELGSKNINPGASADIVATSISLHALTIGRNIIRLRPINITETLLLKSLAKL